MNKKIDKLKLLNHLLNYLQNDLNFENCLEKVATEFKFDKPTKERLYNEVFHNGIDSFIYELNNFINQKMKQGIPRNFRKYNTTEKIRFLIFYRINLINKLFNREILLKLILKHRSPIKLNKMLFNISDEIWFLSGDNSTDFNYYSKRFILMNIYTTSFLYNLRDNSKDFLKTKHFLDKQIDSVISFGRLKSKVKSFFYSKTM